MEGRGNYAFSQTVGTMAHESHGFGLPDLYDTSFQHDPAQDPSEDSAGIGKWGLMGMGAHGWHGNDGPNPFCAWSLEQLGWIGRDNERVVEVRGDHEGVELRDLHRGGVVCKIPLFSKGSEYLLLEHRTSSSHFYNRSQPGDGVLIWHIQPGAVSLKAGKTGNIWYGIVREPDGQIDVKEWVPVEAGPWDEPVEAPAGTLEIRDVLHGMLDSAEELPADDGTDQEIPTNVERDEATEEHPFALLQNYPNPFTYTTTIPYVLASPSLVRLEIFDALGQRVRRLVDEAQDRGEQRLQWDAADDGGQAVASGVYLYHMEVPGSYRQSRKMLLLGGGLSQLLDLDAGLQARGLDWTVLGTDLERSVPTVYGYAVTGSPFHLAFTAGALWSKVQASAHYGQMKHVDKHARQLLDLLAILDPGGLKLKDLGVLVRQLHQNVPAPRNAALLEEMGVSIRRLIQGHGELAGTGFFLGEMLQGVRSAAIAARLLRIPLKEVVDTESTSASLRHMSDYLVVLGAAKENNLDLRRLGDLLEAGPQSRAEFLQSLEAAMNARYGER